MHGFSKLYWKNRILLNAENIRYTIYTTIYDSKIFTYWRISGSVTGFVSGSLLFFSYVSLCRFNWLSNNKEPSSLRSQSVLILVAFDAQRGDL